MIFVLAASVPSASSLLQHFELRVLANEYIFQAQCRHEVIIIFCYFITFLLYHSIPGRGDPSPSPTLRRSLRAISVSEPGDSRESSPFSYRVPESPDSALVQQLLKQLFTADSKSAWLLMGYSDPDTVAYQAHGTGSVNEVGSKLLDTEIQFCLVRIPVNKEGSTTVSTRDVLIAWIGRSVGIMERGKRRLHLDFMSSFLKVRFH